MMAKARVLRTHSSLRRAENLSKICETVLMIWKSAIIHSPIITAVARAKKTERLKIASKIAISGGNNPKIPYSIVISL
jgi:hypothetical protein